MDLLSLTALLFLCLILFCLTSLQTPVTAISDADKPSAYDVIQTYDLPVGLLPKGVSRYELDSKTGKFSAYLNATCSFHLENSYQLKYKTTITGYISKDKLTKLKGVSVKVLVLWLNIVEVLRSGDELEFLVGIVSAGFPVYNFEECPQCGCGLDCVNGKVRRIRTNPFVSSS